MKHLIVNLPRHTARRAFMLRKLEHAGIEAYTFLPAVDQATMKHPRRAYPVMRHGKAAPAVYASTLKAMQCMVDCRWSHYVHLEDDVYLHQDYAATLEKYWPRICEFDLVYLGHHVHGGANKGNQPLHIPHKRLDISGTYGMVISNRFAEFMIAHRKLNKRRNTIDYVMSRSVRRGRFRTALMFPRLVMPEVRGSTNMPHRDMAKFANKFNYDPTAYSLVDEYSQYIGS